jgi:hypothetical protein
MANTLTEVTPKLLAQGLMALRENAIMARLVNRAYESMAGQKGSTIDVPIPSAITSVAVSPSNTPPSTADIAPTSVAIPMDQWYEAPFYLTDKDLLTCMEGTIPMQASEAIKSLANRIDSYILGLYTGVYGWQGTAGTTPFGSGVLTADATGVRKILNKQLAPLTDRRIILDPDAEAAALELAAFRDMSQSGTDITIVSGNIGRKFGMDWFMDQNVPTHTAGTISNGTAQKAKINDADFEAGATQVAIDDTSLTGTVVVGDVFTVAGDTQTYTVTEAATAASNAIAALKFSPAAKVAWADDAVVTFKGSHVVNLAFHRDAFAFATRPLEANAEGLGAIIRSAVDPVSGLTLRLEITREHKRTRFSYDILYGGKLVRPELASRLAG